MPVEHRTLTTPFAERATSAPHPLSSYLFRLMELKSSNLCLSADVNNVRELISLADHVGPSIVVLKTHYDLIAGWDYNPQTGTGARLAALARKHGFLIFEDRKFVDIGKTVQGQYTAGTARIIDWAHITNANMDAGADMVRALAEAAAKWKERYHYEVSTSCTVGSPLRNGFEGYLLDDTPDRGQEDDDDHDDEVTDKQGKAMVDPLAGGPSPATAAGPAAGGNRGELGVDDYTDARQDGRKGSIVSITTLTQLYEPLDSPRASKNGALLGEGDDAVFPGIEEPPVDRGLLLLAQMSTRGCLMVPTYTQACVEAARNHKAFVMGFVAQECLNAAPDDAFIHMTPGCKLPPPTAGREQEDQRSGAGGPMGGDGLGQQYNTPDKLVRLAGTDIVIVGRGITEADDPQTEAARYRRKAWRAYLDRVQGKA